MVILSNVFCIMILMLISITNARMEETAIKELNATCLNQAAQVVAAATQQVHQVAVMPQALLSFQVVVVVPAAVSSSAAVPVVVALSSVAVPAVVL